MESGGASDRWEAAEKVKNDHEFGNSDDAVTWVLDSSVDHRGRVPCRAKTGVWRATLFIIGIEFSERMSYFGLVTNLIMYLTQVLGQELKTAAKNVNYWGGVTTMMPLLGGFISDSYLGRFNTVVISSTIYLAGLGLLSMSQFIPGMKAPPLSSSSPSWIMKRHEVIFFTSMYLISFATGGHKPALESFGADQFDGGHILERKHKMSYFNWWNTGVSSGLIAGVTLFPYFQDKAGWGVAYLILTTTMAIGLLVFYSGKSFYRYKPLEGSNPLIPLVRVLVAAVAKRHLPYPVNPALELYEISNGKYLLGHTTSLRCLDKAAIVEVSISDSDQEFAGLPAPNTRNPWRLATVTEVEQLKQVIRMVPVWLTTQTFGLCLSQTSTFFVKQASVMDRRVGPSFEIPPTSIAALNAIGMIFLVTIYEKVLIPFLRRIRSHERGISILQRIGIGMIFSSLAMAVAALVEKHRLTAVPAKISVWWLAPQFLILGFADGFTLVGLQEYFYEQMPDGMRSLGIGFYLSVIGASSFLASLLITVVDHITEALGSGKSWFSKDINSTRLDYFYWLLAILNAINLCVYVFVATKTFERRVTTFSS